MKRLFKILAWTAAIFLIIVVLLVIGVKLFFPVEKAKAMAIEKSSKMLGRPIHVKDVSLSFWGGLGIELHEVVIGSPAGMEVGDFLRADAVDLKLQLFPLLKGSYYVDKLIINSPVITLVKRPDGANNYTFTFPEEELKEVTDFPAEQLPAETKAAATAVSFEQFEIHDGRLIYRDDSSHTEIRLGGINVATELDTPRKGVYTSGGKISIDSVSVLSEQTLPTLSASLRYTAEYNLPQKHLSFEKTSLTVNQLKFTLGGEVTYDSTDITARLSIISDMIAVRDLFSLLPQAQQQELTDYAIAGDFSLDVDVDYDSRKESPLVYSGTATISDMTMSKKDIAGSLALTKALIDFKPDKVRINIEEGAFDGQPLQGHVVVNDFEDPFVNGALSGKCDLAFLAPFLPPEGKHELQGMMDFDLTVSGKVKEPKNMGFSGSAKVAAGRYRSVLLPEPIDSFALDVFFDDKVALINNFAARSTSCDVSLSGRLTNLVPYFLADSTSTFSEPLLLNARLNTHCNLELFNSFLPPAGKPELKGQLRASLDLSGDILKPPSFKIYGQLTLDNASYTDSLLPEPIRTLDVAMQLSPDTVIIDSMYVRFESSDLALTGKLAEPLPYFLESAEKQRSMRKPFFLFSVRSHRFDVDKLFPEATPGSGVNRAELPADSLPPIILPDINGEGTIRFDTVIYSRVEFTQLTGKVGIQNRKIRCYDVTGKVYTGTVAGNTTIDLHDFNHPQYTGEFKAADIEANDFVTRFSKFGGHLYGKANLQGKYSARGWEPDEFLNSLTMNATADMREGKLVTSGVLYTTLSKLAQQAGRTFQKEQPLRGLTTKIIVKDGKVKLDKLKTKVGTIGDLELDGSYSFENELDYRGSLLLSKEWTQDLMSKGGLLGGLAGLFADQSVKRLKLPLVIGGTVDKPTFNIDLSSLGKNATENVKEKAGNLLKDLFKKKDKP